jgi:hypothetical protein
LKYTSELRGKQENRPLASKEMHLELASALCKY